MASYDATTLPAAASRPMPIHNAPTQRARRPAPRLAEAYNSGNDTGSIFGSSFTSRPQLRPYSVFGRYKFAFGSTGPNGVSERVDDISDDETTPLNRSRPLGMSFTTTNNDSTLGGFSISKDSDDDSLDHTEDFHATVQRMIDPQTGNFCIQKINRGNMIQYYLKDLFHTLVDSPWYRLSLLLLTCYILAFLVYACLYYWFSSYCDVALPSFAAAFVMSLQIHMTIGYGEYAYIPTLNCPIAVSIVAAQCMTALVMSAILFGLFYARFARPSLRNQTLWFSKKAIISNANGQSCLMFRVANIRKSEIIEARVKLVLGFINKNRQGHWEYQFQTLNLSHSRDIILAVPWTIIHPITKASPLFRKSKEEMRDLCFEVICFIYGTNSSTGNLFEKRRSYTVDEIVWNGRFANILSRNKRNQWMVDYGCFHRIIGGDDHDTTTDTTAQPGSLANGGDHGPESTAPVVPSSSSVVASDHSIVPIDEGDGGVASDVHDPVSTTVSPSSQINSSSSEQVRATSLMLLPGQSNMKVSPEKYPVSTELMSPPSSGGGRARPIPYTSDTKGGGGSDSDEGQRPPASRTDSGAVAPLRLADTTMLNDDIHVPSTVIF